jgi:hypothetical protein
MVDNDFLLLLSIFRTILKPFHVHFNFNVPGPIEIKISLMFLVENTGL